MFNFFSKKASAEPEQAPGIEVPGPSPLFWPPTVEEEARHATAYFDPERWDEELVRRQPNDDRDRVVENIGRLEGNNRAALFISDFHLSDGSAGGDDFLESHLAWDDDLGFYTGFFPAGLTRGKLFASVLTFALQRIEEQTGVPTRLDLVLNGDVVNFLALRGRGGALVSHKHRPFFGTLIAAPERMEVFWLRGNHDFVVPEGPWHSGEFYVNPGLRVLAEHGDFWDKQNWPPGPNSKGARLVIEGGAAFEVHSPVMKDGTVKYMMAGVDNLRPWSNDAIEAFLDRRARYSDVAWFAALVARLKYLGAADDSAAYQGALERRRMPAYADWLMVQGHTHVPALVPGVYYNTGCWISTLLTLKKKEEMLEIFPFLLVYLDANGRRIEEYFTTSPARDGTAKMVRHNVDSIGALRESCGYKALPGA